MPKEQWNECNFLEDFIFGQVSKVRMGPEQCVHSLFHLAGAKPAQVDEWGHLGPHHLVEQDHGEPFRQTQVAGD